MTVLPKDLIPKQKMAVDQFLVWSQTVPGRYELHEREVVVMQSESAAHARAKSAMHRVLCSALEAAGRDRTREALPDGMTFRISDCITPGNGTGRY
jgi:hypothetical protein